MTHSVLESCSLYVLVLLLFVFNTSKGELAIQKISDGEVNTSVKDVKLQGIAFKKREINESVPASVSFRVTGDVEAHEHVRAWSLNGVRITDSIMVYGAIPSLRPPDIYTTEVNDGDGLIITLYLKNKYLVPGNYTLTITPITSQGTPVSASASVSSAPVLPLFEKVRKVLDGDRLTISCHVTGLPLPRVVSWKFYHIKPEFINDPTSMPDFMANPKTLDDTSDDYSFKTNSVIDDQLVFESLPPEYGGLYVCSVTNELNESDESFILVNIKDRWAALWPFIGIVIEVTLLVAGILLYERHQMRSRVIKTDAPGAPTVDLSPKSLAEAHALAAQQQQNNVSAMGELPVEGIPDGNRASDAEAGDDRPEDVRMRSAAQC